MSLSREVSLIKNEMLRDDVVTILKKIPEYFWTIPASSTGKYHPSFSLGEGGLVRHVKTAVKIAESLLVLDQFNFNDEEIDIVYASLILHDCLKHGYDKSEFTQVEHPLYMARYIVDLKKEGILSSSEDTIRVIAETIATHMGQWSYDNSKRKVLPEPESNLERFVHLCDYLSSRKFLDIKFIDDEIVE